MLVVVFLHLVEEGLGVLIEIDRMIGPRLRALRLDVVSVLVHALALTDVQDRRISTWMTHHLIEVFDALLEDLRDIWVVGADPRASLGVEAALVLGVPLA